MPRVSIAILAIGLVAAASAAEAAKPGVTCTATQLSSGGAQTCSAKGDADKKNGLTRVHVVICLPGGMMMCCVPSADNPDQYDCSSHTWYLRLPPGGELPQLQIQPPPGGGLPPLQRH